MHLKSYLLLLSIVTFLAFTFFSYTVAKEVWQTIDFDTTVKLQNHIPRKFDYLFSYFSIIGSAEVTIGLAGIISVFYLLKRRLLAFLAWLVIVPASLFEVYGKLMVFHPAPPDFFHRNALSTSLPSFYIHTNYSYPSGHLTRTIFLVTVFFILTMVSKKDPNFKIIISTGLLVFAAFMFMTRIYLGEHWLSDVLGGSLLGLAAGLFASVFIVGKKYAKM